MDFVVKIKINKYLEAINNKLKELEYLHIEKKKSIVDKRYNSFLNRIIFKNSKEEILSQVNIKLFNYKKQYPISDDNFEISEAFKLKEIIPQTFQKTKDLLLQSKSLGVCSVNISNNDIKFIKKYESNSIYMISIINKYDNRIVNCDDGKLSIE